MPQDNGIVKKKKFFVNELHDYIFLVCADLSVPVLLTLPVHATQGP